MSEDNSTALTVGSASVQSTYEPWPNYWQPSNVTIWPTYIPYSAPTNEEYANEVEVDQDEHDATLRFYRRRGTGRTLVKEVTVPLGVLEWLQGEQG